MLKIGDAVRLWQKASPQQQRPRKQFVVLAVIGGVKMHFARSSMREAEDYAYKLRDDKATSVAIWANNLLTVVCGDANTFANIIKRLK